MTNNWLKNYRNILTVSYRKLKTGGFTLIELIVATTIMLMLTSMAATTAYNFIQAVAKLKTQYENLRYNIAVLYTDLAQAKMNYATDLTIQLSATPTPTPTPSPAPSPTPSPTPEAQLEIQHWNTLANQNQNPQLIARLINPDPKLPNLPLTPLTPGSTSYLPSSRTVQETIYVNGKPVINTVTVQITDINSLLKAYLLTDNGTSTGNIVATITVGTMLDVQNQVRPTLPIIDWRSGTLQEIVFPSNLATP
jgi:prepilin-type N-terminal cleavage/methylation domain-containing protein